ncbi:MAG: sigma-70 family RNA polymerase sigma factor [Myxococcota bacterium]
MSAAAACSAPALSDEQLVTAVLAGDAEAFDTLYDRYVGRVYRFVEKRLHNRADAEETTQEVFAAVFSSLDSFRAEAPFAAWVLGIARFTIASRFKKKQHPTVPFDLDEDGELSGEPMVGGDRAATPLEVYELRERLTRLETAAEKLSEEQRRLFVLHHVEHRPIADIAQLLDKSEDAVKSNLYRARKMLLAR